MSVLCLLPEGSYSCPVSLEPSFPVGSAGSSRAVQTSSGQRGCAIAPVWASALLQPFIPVPVGAQVCLGTREFVGTHHGLFSKHIPNIIKLNLNALEIQMPASVFISPVLLRHTEEGSWLTVGFSGVFKLLVFWHLIPITTLLIFSW